MLPQINAFKKSINVRLSELTSRIASRYFIMFQLPNEYTLLNFIKQLKGYNVDIKHLK